MTTPKREPSVRDVAEAAGVSKAQAARALGGYGSVGENVRQQVLAAAEKLGYRQNALARSIAGNATRTIGAVVADVSNPFFAQAVSGIASVLRGHGYSLFLADSGEQGALEDQAVNAMLDHRVDGFIVSPTVEVASEPIQEALRMGRPIVLIDRTIIDSEFDLVSLDHEGAARTATRHLLELGHRKIAFVSSAGSPGPGYRQGSRGSTASVTERLTGFIDELNRAGVSQPERYVRFDALSRDGGARIIEDLLEVHEPPTAVIASDSMTGAEVFRSISALGRSVPDDCALVTFDDSPWTTLVRPRVTVIAQPATEIGVRAAEMLIRRLGGDDSAPERVLFDGELIVRESSGRSVSP